MPQIMAHKAPANARAIHEGTSRRRGGGRGRAKGKAECSKGHRGGKGKGKGEGNRNLHTGPELFVTYLMACHQIPGQRPIISQDVHNLSIGQLMTRHDILAIHLCTDHVVANVRVYMIGKVQDRGTLHSRSHLQGSVTLSCGQACILEMTASTSDDVAAMDLLGQHGQRS